MTDQPLGRRALEAPVGADMGQWAAGEVTKHEELCGLRYEAIDERMKRIEAGQAEGLAAANARSKAIEDRIGNGIRWIMSIVAALAVALIMMFLNDSKTRAQADESDKREMRARLSLLTQQLSNVQPHAFVVTPPGSQTTTIPAAPTKPLDAEDLSDATGGKPGG